MASLYIAEYAAVRAEGLALVPVEPPVAEQKLTIGAASVPSAAFNAATRYVRLVTDAICSVTFSAAGQSAATVASSRMAAGTERVCGVNGGGFVAVITNT